MSFAFPIQAPLTWVGDRGDGDLVVGFTCAEACDDVLDPPQLLSHLDFLMLLTKKHTQRVKSELNVFKEKKALMPSPLFPVFISCLI